VVYVEMKKCVHLTNPVWCKFSSVIVAWCEVDYGTTAEELEAHFNGCGPVNRVTILCDRFSGRPKGFV